MIPDLFHVLPDFALLVRIAKEISGMKGRHYLHAEIVLEFTTQASDADFCIQQILGRGVSHHHDHLWTHDRDLAQQKRFTRFGFRQRWCTIARRTAAVDVSDKHVFAFQPDTLDDLPQQLSGTPDEWSTLLVLIGTRSFSDKHQV